MAEKSQAVQCLHAVVEGRVQGVGFRYFVERNALALNLDGWVRNRWNRTVEVVVEGPTGELEQLIEALRRGPRSAFVSDLKIEWKPATGEFNGFHIRMTG